MKSDHVHELTVKYFIYSHAFRRFHFLFVLNSPLLSWGDSCWIIKDKTLFLGQQSDESARLHPSKRCKWQREWTSIQSDSFSWNFLPGWRSLLSHFTPLNVFSRKMSLFLLAAFIMTSWRWKHGRQTEQNNTWCKFDFYISRGRLEAVAAFLFDLFLPCDKFPAADVCVCLVRTCRGVDESDETVFFALHSCWCTFYSPTVATQAVAQMPK